MTFPYWANRIWLLLEHFGYIAFSSWKNIFICGYELTLFCAILYSYVLCLILALFTNHHLAIRITKSFIYLLLSSLTIIELFLGYRFSFGISPNALTLLSQTNAQECSEFIARYVLTGPTAFIVFIVLSTTVFLIHSSRLLYKHILIRYSIFNSSLTKGAVLCTFIGILIYSLPHFLLLFKSNTQEYPTDTVSKSIYALRQFNIRRQETANLIKNIQADLGECFCSYTSPRIVVVIGESFNKHHSNLYGYYLNTNPRLTSRHQDDELFVYTNVVTPFNLTSECIKYLLSTENAHMEAKWYDKPLFPIIFRNAGYKVFWMDNQILSTTHDEDCWNWFSSYLNHPTVESALFDVRNTQLYPYDAELLSEWEKCRHMQSRNDLIVFHLLGQHIDTQLRYPQTEEYRHFTADSVRRHDLDIAHREEIAHYDNATRYNDMVVDSIISYFEEEDAVVIYFSDHGDEANDYREHLGRSYEIPLTANQVKNQFEIPMMIWCSETYREHHPDIVRQIRESVNRPFMIDDICHLLFDLAGIRTPYYDETRSIINPLFKPRKRMLWQREFYEDIR